jgi:hypothetical protein
VVVATPAVTPRKLLVAALATLALLAAALLVEVAVPKWHASRDADRAVLWGGHESIGTFTIERRGQTWTFEPRPTGGWAIRATGVPRELRADVRGVQDIEKALGGFGGIRTVLARDAAKADLASYGLAEPDVKLRWIDDRGRSRSLALGTPLAGGASIAAITEDGRLVLLPREIREAADRDLGVFREKAVLGIAKWADIEKLEIEREGPLPPGASPRIVISRDHSPAAGEDSWVVDEPKRVAGNGTRITAMVSKLAGLVAAGYGAEVPSPADLVAVGLAPPAATVTITRADGAPLVLDFGSAAGDLAWCWDRKGPLVQVRADLRADMLLADDFYRDNRALRMPRWSLQNLRVQKGLKGQIDLEIQKDGDRGWYVVKPADMPLEASDAEGLFDTLDEVLCGRFEDEMAAQPGAADLRWDFAGPGSLRIEASGMLPGGGPLRIDLDATVFKHGGVYYAVRTIDQDMKEQICIVDTKAFDPFFKRVDPIVDRAQASGRLLPVAPPTTSGATGPTP